MHQLAGRSPAADPVASGRVIAGANLKLPRPCPLHCRVNTPDPVHAVMDVRAGVVALAGGVAAFVIGFVAVTELLSATIEFSVFLGIPAGIVAGVITAGIIVWAINRELSWLAFALGGFGLGFLAGTAIGAVFTNEPFSVLLVVGIGVGFVGAIAGVLWARATR